MKLDPKGIEAAYETLGMPDHPDQRRPIEPAIRAYLSAVPSSPVSEPVAWRLYCDGYVHTSRPEVAAGWGKYAEPLYLDPPPTSELEAENARLRGERDEARQALEEIRDLKERPYEEFPADWREQIAVCPECKRYADHPIQRGICNEHRRPLYAREDHDKHETKILGYRAKDIARDALARRAREGGKVDG